MRLQPPAGFTAFAAGNHHGIVRDGVTADVRELMAVPFDQIAVGGPALAGRGTRRMERGRAGPLIVTAKTPDSSVVIRPYAHGGLLGAMLRARARWFPSPSRGLREAAVAARAAELGLPVPTFLGMTADRHGAGWTMEAWTALLAGALPLPEAVRTLGVRALPAAGAALRRCMDAGLRHADLNAGNILARADGGACQAWIVDLDRATLGGALSPGERLAHLRRLYRSLAKTGVSPSPVGDRDFLELAGACLAAPLAAGAARDFLASCRRAVAWHGLLWRKT